jgi:hypothetical protein
MIRALFFTLLLSFSVACGSMKSKCIPVVATTAQVDMVQVNEAGSMLTYRLESGPFKGSMLFVNRIGEEEKRTDVSINNPNDPFQCLTIHPETAIWKQEISENGQDVTLSGTASLLCDKKTYCLEFSYSGPLMRSPGMKSPQN